MDLRATPQITTPPVFYDGGQMALEKVRSALLQDGYAERVKNQVVHGYDPEQYLLLWEERFKAKAKSMRKLWEMYTTVHRRFRGVTVSDQFGYFGTRPETQGRWIEYNPESDGEVHPINIVRPDIRANVCALLQINEEIDVDSPNQDARFLENARRLQYLVDFFQRDTWTEGERTLIFDGIQKEGTLLIETLKDLDKCRTQSITLPTKLIQHYAVASCPECGQQGVKEIGVDEIAAHNGQQGACPDCSAPMNVSAKTLTNYDADEGQIQTTEIGHRVISGYNYLIDRVGARRKGIQSAKYLRVMELIERSELEDAYPQHTFDAPWEWDYGVKCQHALANADWTLLYSTWQPASHSPEWDLFQKNTNYLHEATYKNYISPKDWEFRGRNGRLKFKIARGQSWKEAVKNSMGSDCEGFRYVTVNEQLIDVEGPPDFEPNFRKCFSDIHFQRDSGSYHSVPNWDSCQLQDDITLFNTLKVETTARNSVEPVWFNSEIFSETDFGRDYIPSKNGAMDPETDIKNAVFKPPIARATDGINEHLTFLLGIRREVSGVQPALLGESQPGQPYAAQRQQLDQAFGLLTSAAKSYAQMKVESTKQKIYFAFKYWSLEQFQSVASSFGEQWDEADVAQLVATDLTRDVSIDYITGSETPQGNLTKELRFFNGLREITQFMQFLPPAIQTQIMKRVGEFAEFDLDVSGAETTDALAQKRYRSLANACADLKPLTPDDIAEYKQQVVGQNPPDANAQPAQGRNGEVIPPQPTPITAWDLLVEEIMAGAQIVISPMEDAQAQINFFVPQISVELAKPQPNYTLIDMMEWFVGQMQAKIPPPQDPEGQAKLVETMGYKDVPEDIKRQMEGKAGFTPSTTGTEPPLKDVVAAHKASLDAKKLDVEQERTQADREHIIDTKVLDEASKENERDFEREKMAHDDTQGDKEREHSSAESDKERKARASEAKNKPKPPAKKK